MLVYHTGQRSLTKTGGNMEEQLELNVYTLNDLYARKATIERWISEHDLEVLPLLQTLKEITARIRTLEEESR